MHLYTLHTYVYVYTHIHIFLFFKHTGSHAVLMFWNLLFYLTCLNALPVCIYIFTLISLVTVLNSVEESCAIFYLNTCVLSTFKLLIFILQLTFLYFIFPVNVQFYVKKKKGKAINTQKTASLKSWQPRLPKYQSCHRPGTPGFQPCSSSAGKAFRQTI